MKLRRALAALEAFVAVALFVLVFKNAGVRALFATCSRAIADAALSALALIPKDPATLLLAFAAWLRVVFLLGPFIKMLVVSPRHRLAWVPFASVVFVGVLGVSVPGVNGAIPWAVLAFAAAGAWRAVEKPALRVLALLPWLVVLEPMLGHSPLSDSFWSASRLEARCKTNDGVRPVDLDPSYEVSRYYAVTPIDETRFVVTSERRSFLAERKPDGTVVLGPPLRMRGNMWQGCVRNGSVWLTKRDRLFALEVPPPGEAPVDPPERLIPGAPDLGVELDYVDPICPEDRPTVYVSQLVRGGYLEVDPTNNATTFHRVIEGLNLQLVQRRDGLLAGITTGRFVLFDPKTDRVVEDHPAGVVAMGLDVCMHDDAVAITDFVGRVRLFEVGASGRYELTRGAFVRAPRRIAFSPSCDRIAVTSGTDRDLYVLRRSDLAVTAHYELGPGLRDLVFLDEGTVAAADACTVNLLDAR
ncbi:MAG: hypothetical protein U0271_24415 [Polyangiaceae bacterium]